MNRAAIIESIRGFFETDLLKRSQVDHVSNSDNVISAGIVDSLGIVKIISYLENAFSVEIDDSDLVMENFETIESMATFVGNCKNR
jgi:acyl carrier protein